MDFCFLHNAEIEKRKKKKLKGFSERKKKNIVLHVIFPRP